MLNQPAHLRLAFDGVKRLRAALDDVTHAVELRRRAAKPERMQRFELAGFRLRVERFRNDRERAARAGEAAVLREAAELDRTFASTRYFIY